MKATLLLANAGQADSSSGTAHLLGAGWSVTMTPTPPMALVLIVDVPWDQTNMKHKLKIELLDADGHPVTTQGPLGQTPLMTIEAEFEAGRPPGVPAGTPQRQQLVVNVGPGLPLQSGEKYEFRLTIGGKVMDSWLATFFVR